MFRYAFDENGIVYEKIYKKLLFDKLSLNSGMLMENIVSQMLVAAGHKLFFSRKTHAKIPLTEWRSISLLPKAK